MDKEEIKRRINRRIDEDDSFAGDVGKALQANNDRWLVELISDVIGFVIVIGSALWDWLIGQWR